MTEYLFTYPEYGESILTDHIAHSGQRCTVVKELDDSDRDAEVGPMYSVRFADGAELAVYGDELTPHPPITNLVLHEDEDGPYWESAV